LTSMLLASSCLAVVIERPSVSCVCEEEIRFYRSEQFRTSNANWPSFAPK
jgi:hypothetical protein